MIYGRLTLTGEPYLKSRGGSSGKMVSHVIAKCNCGNVKEYQLWRLKTGHTKSCGCLKNEASNYKHGLSSHPLYWKLDSIIARCYNPNNPAFKNYGKRGILVCDEWRESHENFHNWAIRNGWADGLEIDRINNDGNYEPSNCRFVLKIENNRNKRTNKLSFYKAVAIRNLFRIGAFTRKELSVIFDVAKSNINAVINNKSWTIG